MEDAVPMKRWILLLLPAAMIAALTGCGGSTFNVQNPQGPPPSNVTVSGANDGIDERIGSGQWHGDITATVQGTSAQVADGVAWYISCQGASGGACGTLSSPSSASGAAITYTAPAAISSQHTDRGNCRLCGGTADGEQRLFDYDYHF